MPNFLGLLQTILNFIILDVSIIHGFNLTHPTNLPLVAFLVSLLFTHLPKVFIFVLDLPHLVSTRHVMSNWLSLFSHSLHFSLTWNAPSSRHTLIGVPLCLSFWLSTHHLQHRHSSLIWIQFRSYLSLLLSLPLSLNHSYLFSHLSSPFLELLSLDPKITFISQSPN